MFILLYNIIKSQLIRIMELDVPNMAGTIAVGILAIICIRIALSLVGVHTSGHTSGMLIGAIINGIAYIARTVITAIGWVIRRTVEVTPRVYASSKGFYRKRGINDLPATILAAVTTIGFIAIII